MNPRSNEYLLGDRMVKVNTICAQYICLIRAIKHFSSVSFFLNLILTILKRNCHETADGFIPPLPVKNMKNTIPPPVLRTKRELTAEMVMVKITWEYNVTHIFFATVWSRKVSPRVGWVDFVKFKDRFSQSINLHILQEMQEIRLLAM